MAGELLDDLPPHNRTENNLFWLKTRPQNYCLPPPNLIQSIHVKHFFNLTSFHPGAFRPDSFNRWRGTERLRLQLTIMHELVWGFRSV